MITCYNSYHLFQHMFWNKNNNKIWCKFKKKCTVKKPMDKLLKIYETMIIGLKKYHGSM